MPANLSKPKSRREPKPEVRPKPSPSVRTKAPAALREYAALRLFLSQDVGFRLALARFDRPATRDGLIARLADDLAKSRLLLSTLDLATGEGPLLSRIQEHLAAQPTPPGWRRSVAVVNLEDRLSYSAVKASAASPGERDLTLLEEANLHRDAFPSVCPCPLLLWLTELSESALARTAPDLWHWRNARFDFQREGSFLEDFRAHPAERAAWFEKIAEASHRLGDKRGEIGDLIHLGNAKIEIGNAKQAIETYKAALELAREIGDRQGEGGVLGNLGSAYRNLGETRKAIELYEQALVIAREIGDRRGQGSALVNLGIAYADLGELRKAIEFYEQSLVIGDRRGEGRTLGNLGSAYAALGETRKAIQFYEQSLVISREIGDRRGEGTALWNSALTFDTLGERAQAFARAEAALQILEAIEDPNTAKLRARLAKWRKE
jgi:tetratricopeptide (TPR) repeat protein